MKFALIHTLVLAATLVAHSASANEPAVPAAKGDPKKAEGIVNQVCAACHAVDGNSVMPANPKLAGLNYEYLHKQLLNFKSGERKSAVMSGMVATLTPEDMQNLAAYFSSQQPKEAKAKDQALALLGQKVFRGGVQGTGVPACA
jgi:cytochrome c553